ncbi:MAG: hypothetical protein OXU20_05185 [Myxococcales bacterium]|nr:hypothetical protein [Myxococcales bacterium]
MLCRQKFLFPRVIRWGPIAVISVATGCVPDIPIPDEPDGGASGAITERDGLESTPTAGVGGGSDSTGDPTVPDNGMSAGGESGGPGSGDPTGPTSMVPTAPGQGPAVVEEMVEMMPYLCQADSDCAESLVCQDEECVFVPPERVPTTTVQTVGGSLVTGSGLRLQLRIGAPPPVGRMSGRDHHLTLGPLAGH